RFDLCSTCIKNMNLAVQCSCATLDPSKKSCSARTYPFHSSIPHVFRHEHTRQNPCLGKHSQYKQTSLSYSSRCLGRSRFWCWSGWFAPGPVTNPQPDERISATF